MQAEATATGQGIALKSGCSSRRCRRSSAAAASELANANVTVLNGGDGLSEIAAGLVSQGMAILDAVREGMPGQPQGRIADNGQVVSGQVAQREP